MENQQKASLRDVLNYEVETYFKPEELSLIRSTFKNSPKLLSVLRKAFLPTFADLELPLEELGKDMWIQGRDYAGIPSDEAKILMIARQEAIKFVAGALIQLKIMAHSPEENEMEKALRRTKDSTQ